MKEVIRFVMKRACLQFAINRFVKTLPNYVSSIFSL